MNQIYDQQPFVLDDFPDNPEPRCPVILLLDTSSSMGGEPIAALNAGLQIFEDELKTDSLAAKRVEVAVVTFGPVDIVNDFFPAYNFNAPELNASGITPMGEAVITAIELLGKRKERYKENGIAYYRPWIFLITDGAPTDTWAAAAEKIKAGEARKEFMFYAVGVEGADFTILNQLSVRAALRLKDLNFKDLFCWLSNSLGSVSRSYPGDQIRLANPTAPDGWGEVG